MQKTFQINTNKHNGLYDITSEVRSIVSSSGVQTGLVNVYVQGATAAIMIQENWDESVQNDVVTLFKKLLCCSFFDCKHVYSYNSVYFI